MGLKMKVCFGTYELKEIEIDLDDYSTPHVVGSSEQQRKDAFDLLHDTMNDYTFMDDGYRNEDAVNSLIALHVLGYDAEEWMDSFLWNEHSLFHSIDICKFQEHVERVIPYLSKWGPKDHEGLALSYAIN